MDVGRTGKQLELLKEGVPTIAHVAVLVNPMNPNHDRLRTVFAAEARALGVQLQRVEARDPGAFDAAFATVVRSGVDALLIWDDSMFSQNRHRLLEQVRAPSADRVRRAAVCRGEVPRLLQSSGA